MSCKKKVVRIVSLLMALLLFTASSVTVFADEESDKVITGKDGWYFYDSDRSMEDYRGDDLFTEYQLSNILTRLVAARDYFAAQGIPFVVFMAPNKEHVYSEYMPDEYGEPAAYTRIEQLYDYLSGELTVVSPLPSIMNAKQTWPQYYFYYKTDTHWDQLGAYIGAKDLMSAIGYTLPDLSALSVSSMTTPGRDLARKLGIENSVQDIDYSVEGYGPYNNIVEDIDERGNYINYHIENAPAKNMVILGDSFSMGMAPYLGQEFENIYIHRFTYRKSEIMAEEPSVVVYELVERALDYMPQFELLDE